MLRILYPPHLRFFIISRLYNPEKSRCPRKRALPRKRAPRAKERPEKEKSLGSAPKEKITMSGTSSFTAMRLQFFLGLLP